MSDHIRLDIQDHIATITLDRPEARNALSLEMRTGLAEFTSQVEFDPDVRCVVLRGAGGHFMAGGDVKSFKRRQGLSHSERKREVLQGLHLLHYAIYRIRRMPKPVLASVQGGAAGAGVSLMAACDLAIAADDAFMVLAYANIGLSPDGSGTFFLPRLLGLRRTMEMALLPERMDAQTAREWGLVNRVVPAAELEAETLKLAERLASGPTYAFGRAKALLNASFDNPLEAQLELEGNAIADCMTTDDHEEGVNAFVEKRSPHFVGH
ncbi:MAG TPA: enoyl-CoA hydratase [bacterium]|nr:enoyl-CoA hydratase [bacterium]